MLLLIVTCIGILPQEQTYAATSYTNAYEFYHTAESRLKGRKYSAEAEYGNVYYATSAKVATSSSNLRYHTLGFDITLTGNGRSVSFAVQRGGNSMVEVDKQIVGGYEYILYYIPEQTLYNLATTSNPSIAPTVLSASTIYVTMNAIMTTKQGASLGGGVAENGAGGLSEWGKVYHLGNYRHLSTMKSIFSGHDFRSYTDIQEPLKNPSLSIKYNTMGATSIGGGFGVNGSGDITYNGSLYVQKSTLLQPVYLLNPSSIGLAREGYYLESGKEWVALNSAFSPSYVYYPSWIYPYVVNGSAGITMYANWQVNKYYIAYDANGGDGYVTPNTLKYNENGYIRNNTFTRRGYSLVEGAEWNTKPDGTGVSYTSNQLVKNLSSKNGDVITLYAQWTPNTYEILTNPVQGSGGTDVFYEKFEHGWYADKDCTVPITNIDMPSRVGYDFISYLPYPYGVGETIVDANGKIAISDDFFDVDSMICATYKPKNYTITFDKQGGTGGTDNVIATFDEWLPYAEAPIKTGYTFKGYYADDTFSGEPCYIETMAPNIRYTTPNDVTMYAKWVDDIKPKLGISVSTSNWTNRAAGVEVKTYAYDLGSGLDKVELYCGDTLVAEQKNLKGTKDTIKLEYVHKSEGVYRYRTVSYDMEGNMSEKYESVKYDIKAPTGTLNIRKPQLNDFGVDVQANDYNIQH